MRKRLFGSFLAALFVVGLLAPAALADVNGVAVFSGTADVGDAFGEGGCNKAGGEATGQGLFLDPALNSNPHTWDLETTFTYVGTPSGQPDTGTFHVCGWMQGTVAPLGASCATTKGYHGVGRATGATFDIKLFNVGWKAAAGNVLPVTGNYRVYSSGNTKDVTKLIGNIVATVEVAPTNVPDGCLTAAAEHFTTVGEAVLIQNGQSKAKTDPKKCTNEEGTVCGPGEHKTP